MRLGIKTPLIAGLALMAVGLLLLARAPVDGNFLVDVLPATLAVGLGAGIGFNPILLAAMSGVSQTEAGLASGVVNTAFMMGGALGPGRPREPRRVAHRGARGSRGRDARRAERRLPRRVRRRRGVRRRVGGRRGAVAPSRGIACTRACGRSARAVDRGRVDASRPDTGGRGSRAGAWGGRRGSPEGNRYEALGGTITALMA